MRERFSRNDVFQLVAIVALGLVMIVWGAVCAQSSNRMVQALGPLGAAAGGAALLGGVTGLACHFSHGGGGNAEGNVEGWAETARLLDESAQAKRLGDRSHCLRTKIVVRSKLRCPYCHDSLVGRVSTCSDCQAGLHDECLTEAKGCVTLGCKRRAPKWAVRA